MYHHFSSQSSSAYQTLSNKLNQLLKHYTHLSRQNLISNFLIDTYSDSQNYNALFQVRVQTSLHNPKYNCILFFLSNQKVVRYSLQKQQFSEILIPQEFEFFDLQPLHIGQAETYLASCSNGIIIFTLLPEQKTQIEPQICEKSEQMQEKQILIISKAMCKIVHESIETILERTAQNSQKQVQKLSNPKTMRLRQIKTFIVKDSNLFNKKIIEQEEQKVTIEYERVYILVSFVVSSKGNMLLAAFELTCSSEESGLKVSPVQFYSGKFYAQLAFSLIQVPFDQNKQFQNINPVQITDSNMKYFWSNLIIQADQFFVQTSHQTAHLSIYYVSQQITHEMEQNEWRNLVFQFRLTVDLKRCKLAEVAEDPKHVSPIFHYPQRQVMCPAKVYFLPLTDQAGILRFINITKTLSFDSSKESDDCSITSYKFTTVAMLQNDRVDFCQTELKVVQNGDQTKEQKYKSILNEQDRNWHIKIQENFVLFQILLLDLLKKYALILVNPKQMAVDHQLIPKQNWINQNNSDQDSPKIVVVNLKQNYSTPVCSEYSLTGISENSTFVQCEVGQKTQKVTPVHFLHSEELSIDSNPSILNHSLHLPKTISIIAKKSSEPFETSVHRIDLQPKPMLYHNMLENFLETNITQFKASNQQNQGQMQEKPDKNPQIFNGMDPLFSQILQFLEA